jgi:hypothetical protein
VAALMNEKIVQTILAVVLLIAGMKLLL